MKAHERIRVLVRARDFDGVTLEALRNEVLWSGKMRGPKQVECFALAVGRTGRRRLRGGHASGSGRNPPLCRERGGASLGLARSQAGPVVELCRGTLSLQLGIWLMSLL